MLRWMRRWRERDDQSLVKPSGLFPDIDPIEELSRILGEANADSSGANIVAFASSNDESRSLRVQRSALRQFFRPRSSLPVLRKRTLSPRGDLPRR